MCCDCSWVPQWTVEQRSRVTVLSLDRFDSDNAEESFDLLQSFGNCHTLRVNWLHVNSLRQVQHVWFSQR